MADVAKRPWLTKRGDTYYVRARVPQDLIDTLKRNEIKFSLRTKCPKAALAKVRTEAARIEAEFEAHRSAQNATTSNSETTGSCAPQRAGLRPQELQKICDDHYQRVIDDDFNWRADITEKAAADDEGFRRGQYIAHPTTEWYQMYCGDLDRNEKLLLCFEDQLEHRLNALEMALATANCASHGSLSRDALGRYGVAQDVTTYDA